ncbi:hypothetical protein [Actinomadura kijaniata]|uniref:hypothetical protein n=1 Tax=Actinomadura kijaniata TaxID=46161 RepID=UPI000835FA57|nr:hypothetical protein [Actinomadura kijaniata]
MHTIDFCTGLPTAGALAVSASGDDAPPRVPSSNGLRAEAACRGDALPSSRSGSFPLAALALSGIRKDVVRMLPNGTPDVDYQA